MVATSESVPDVFTRADKGVRGADDPNTKYKVKEYVVDSTTIQVNTANIAAEQDLQAIGLHKGSIAHPDKMTMVRIFKHKQDSFANCFGPVVIMFTYALTNHPIRHVYICLFAG